MSKLGNSLLSLGAAATGTVTERRFVGFDDLQASVQGQKIKGISEYAAVAGDQFVVTAKGTAFVETGGIISVGDPIISDSQGRAITGSTIAIGAGATAVTSSAAAGAILTGSQTPDYRVGYALEAASAAGQFIEILIG